VSVRARVAAAVVILACAAARGEPPSGERPASTLARLGARRPLRVGVHAGAVPFVAAGADAEELRRILGAGAPTLRPTTDGRAVCGLDVELAAEAAHGLGVELELVLVDRFEDLLPRLARGDYDVALGALTRTLERALTVAFTQPYFTTGLEVLVRDAARAASLDALRRREVRVAVTGGTTDAAFAHRRLDGATLVEVGSLAELYHALDDPGVDAVVIDLVAERDAAVRGRTHAHLARVEERRFTTERLAMAVRQGDAEWLRWLDLMLDEMKATGVFHRLAARFHPWFRMER
jgi:polar amino acid transport system substrate-binding protein